MRDHFMHSREFLHRLNNIADGTVKEINTSYYIKSSRLVPEVTEHRVLLLKKRAQSINRRLEKTKFIRYTSY